MTFDDFFKRMAAQYESAKPLVAYSKPNDNKIKAILQDTNDLYYTNDFNEQGFVFSPFDDNKDSVLMPLENSEVISTSQELEVSMAVKTPIENNSISSQSKDFHINLVSKGVEAITAHAFRKVVLSRRETVNLSHSNPILIFKRLLSTYPSAFVYCWYHPQVGLWLGATPEALINIEGQQFSIMALAGTQDYKGTLDVVWKDKEKDEQQIVTNFILEGLKPLTEKIKISETETVKAGNLLHLKTMVSARLKAQSNLKEVLSVLHPTPAVCGFPKLEAKQFILKHENYNREFYTGFLGELNFETTKAPRSGKRNIENRAYAITKKSSQLFVNLRCMQLKGSKAMIYVGGGITKSSNAAHEWEETVSKSRVIKNVL